MTTQYATLQELLTHSTDAQFDILKLLLEKGAFALILAIFGFFLGTLLEKYKASLNRQNEVAKIAIPKVEKMVQASLSLLDTGKNEIRRLAEDFAWAEDWTKSLIGSPALKPLRLMDGKEFSAAVLRPQLQDWLAERAPNEIIRSLVRSDTFWECDDVCKGNECYLRYLSLVVTADESDPYFKHLYFALARITSALQLLDIAPYRRALEAFRLEMLLNLYPENKKQTHAFDSILQALEISAQVLEAFPKDDVLRYTNLTGDAANTKSALEQLLLTHAALVSQISIFIRAQ